MMKKMWKNRSGVSPVIATILMVAITVVLAAVLYVMVMGFGGTDASAPTGSFTAAQKVDSKTMKFDLGSMSKETRFSDCKLTIKNPAGVQSPSVAVDTVSTGFDVGGFNVKVTDLAGDGKISNGDYLTIGSNNDLSPGAYTVTLVWAQDGSQICTKTLTI